MVNGTVLIDRERCKGCELCITVCPQEVLAIDENWLNAQGYHPVMLVEAENHCTGCAICALICPDVCFTVYRETPVRHRVSATA